MTTDEKGTAMRVPPSRDDDTPSERTPEPARVHRQMPNSLAPTACPCASCVAEAGVSAWWMIVCDECGNKRCPHGTDHRHECTGSNEPGQVGSGYARMTSDDRTETITDRAAIRDSDEPDERTPNEVHVDESGCSCKTGPYRGFQRDPIDAACPKHGGPLRHGDGDVRVFHPDGSTSIIREPDERGDFPCCATPAPVGAAVALDLDAAHVRTDPACTFHDGTTPKASRGKICPACMRLDLDAMHETICDNFTGMAEVRQAADALIAEVRSLRAKVAALRAKVATLRARLAAVEAHPVVLELAEERTRQTAKHGDQSHLPDGTGAALWLSMDDDYIRRHGIRRDNLAAWAKSRTDEASQVHGDGSITFEHILTEEWAEAIAESDPVALRAELVQVAAVAVQWVEAIDLRAALATTGEGQ
jgi:hypothetical protein